MYFSGFADEASKDFDKQIKATLELGWENIESRAIGDKNLATLSDKEFEEVEEKLFQNGVKINCYGSSVANWGKDPRSEVDFDNSIKELSLAIPRMQKLGTKMLRGMSFAVINDSDPDSPEIRKLVFSKVKHLVNMCADAGITYLHENCMNYGGMSPEHTLRLVENIDSESFKLVFDTGNPVMTFDRSKPKPYKKQNAFDFYKQVREFIDYVHIKDGIYISESDGVFPNTTWTFPGEGDGFVKEIVADLIKSGYDGGFSMEPHMSVVFHDESVKIKEEFMYKNYLEYGTKFKKIIRDLNV